MVTRSKGALIGAAATTLLLFSPDLGMAAMLPPEVGSQYSFDCSIVGGPSYQETYSVVSLNGDVVRVEVDTGTARNWYEKPYYLTGTTLVQRENVRGAVVSMQNPGREFAGLKELNVGSSFSSYVEERRDGGAERLNWKYTVSLTGRELAYVRDIGDLEVIAITESRWVGLYSSSMLSHYSPQLRFPVYWSYEDSNGAVVECRLASVSGLGGSAEPETVVRAEEPIVEPPKAATVEEPVQPVETPKPKETTVARAEPEPAPAATGAGASLRPAERLARLDELRALDLLSEEEYRAKRSELVSDEPKASGESIEDRLRDANRRFRQKQLSPEDFVALRAVILRRISPSEMDPKRALVLLDDLLEKRLISQIEYNRKRQAMIAAL